MTANIDCIFCKIISGQAAARKTYQDDLATAFWDIHPVAPVHILVVSNRHIVSVNDLQPGDEKLIGHLFMVARQVVSDLGIDQTGYRLIQNNGSHAGQVVFHLHLHVIGGQRMRFPMG